MPRPQTSSATRNSRHQDAAALNAVDETAIAEPDTAIGKPAGFVSKAVKAADKVQRWMLEANEPDTTGRWDAKHRRKVLAYVHARDNGRCGLYGGEMKRKGAQVEHVVPKIFAMFDVGAGAKATSGTRYRSRLHKLDNLQAAHTYCNKRKSNTPAVTKWRHPAMPPLTVADSDNGQFVVPYNRPSKPSNR